MGKIVVSALYQFVRLEEYRQLKTPLLQLMNNQAIRGTLILAREGINGTVAGSPAAIQALYRWLADKGLHGLECKESFSDFMPFHRTKVKLKQEIVTLGVPGVDPNLSKGTYVKPEAWNALIRSEDVTVIDTRNDYEVSIGTFKRAINPMTKTFRSFPEFVKTQLDPKQHKKIAMFCTGGIRCEKSTAYLKQQGFSEVYHLQGGILKYLEEVSPNDSLWQGECFVFDERVTVNHDLQPGQYDQCHACRHPLCEQDKHHPDYVVGESCPRCAKLLSDEQRQRFAERQKQTQLARARGEEHIGGVVADIISTRRVEKKRRKQQGVSIKKQGFTLLEIMIVIAILGILVSLAIPSYQNYTIKARVSEGLQLAAVAKLAVSESVLLTHHLPTNQRETGYQTPAPTPNVAAIVIRDNTGDIEVNYTKAAGGGSLIFHPTLKANGELVWSCQGGSLAATYRPAYCR